MNKGSTYVNPQIHSLPYGGPQSLAQPLMATEKRIAGVRHIGEAWGLYIGAIIIAAFAGLLAYGAATQWNVATVDSGGKQLNYALTVLGYIVRFVAFVGATGAYSIARWTINKGITEKQGIKLKALDDIHEVSSEGVLASIRLIRWTVLPALWVAISLALSGVSKLSIYQTAPTDGQYHFITRNSTIDNRGCDSALPSCDGTAALTMAASSGKLYQAPTIIWRGDTTAWVTYWPAGYSSQLYSHIFCNDASILQVDAQCTDGTATSCSATIEAKVGTVSIYRSATVWDTYVEKVEPITESYYPIRYPLNYTCSEDCIVTSRAGAVLWQSSAGGLAKAYAVAIAANLQLTEGWAYTDYDLTNAGLSWNGSLFVAKLRVDRAYGSATAGLFIITALIALFGGRCSHRPQAALTQARMIEAALDASLPNFGNGYSGQLSSIRSETLYKLETSGDKIRLVPAAAAGSFDMKAEVTST